MSETTDAAESMAAAEPAPPTQQEAKAIADSGEAEGTTPEEVATVLKSSGIDLPADSSATTVDDAEEGDDPDVPAVDEDEASAEGEEEEPAEVDKPVETPAEDNADDKYSITVTDANDVAFKIPVGAKMEDILAKFEPKNNGQILDILNQLGKLEIQKANDEQQAADDTAKEERRTAASKLLEGWQEEAKVLQGDKRIPEGTDGEKRVSQVYKFMADENETRMKANKPTLNSFEDALDKLENKEARDKVVADAKAEKDKARENGAKVGGSSAPASSGQPVYKVGSAKNANQAIRSMGLLE